MEREKEEDHSRYVVTLTLTRAWHTAKIDLFIRFDSTLGKVSAYMGMYYWSEKLEFEVAPDEINLVISIESLKGRYKQVSY